MTEEAIHWRLIMVRFIEYGLTRCPGECMTERQERDTKFQANDIGSLRKGGKRAPVPKEKHP